MTCLPFAVLQHFHHRPSQEQDQGKDEGIGSQINFPVHS
jgi:hypothetical protein